jgi:hypothetical protein
MECQPHIHWRKCARTFARARYFRLLLERDISAREIMGLHVCAAVHRRKPPYDRGPSAVVAGTGSPDDFAPIAHPGTPAGCVQGLRCRARPRSRKVRGEAKCGRKAAKRCDQPTTTGQPPQGGVERAARRDALQGPHGPIAAYNIPKAGCRVERHALAWPEAATSGRAKLWRN